MYKEMIHTQDNNTLMCFCACAMNIVTYSLSLFDWLLCLFLVLLCWHHHDLYLLTHNWLIHVVVMIFGASTLYTLCLFHGGVCSCYTCAVSLLLLEKWILSHWMLFVSKAHVSMTTLSK